nr:ATP-binding cassette domain-containing protein [Treponema parvum]
MFYLAFAPVTYTMLIKIMYANSFNQQSNDALNRIEDILHAPRIKEPENSALPERYDIAFKDVVFSYKTETAGSAETDTGNSNPGGDKMPQIAGRPAVNGISLHIPEHSLTALVGPSGGGKTTLVNLLGRFWEVDSGSISIGGIDIRDIKTSDLLHTVGFVFQENKLFKESIFENIRYGKKDASREEVMEALRKAECMDIIEKLPAGIDTVYGTKGTYVSGGEAQRLAIARALLQDAPIIVLDEATAFADAENEYKIKKTFDVLLKDKTVIMIAHRLSSVVNADTICVINEGRLAETGTHAELLERKGLYAGMWENFQKGIEWKV